MDGVDGTPAHVELLEQALARRGIERRVEFRLALGFERRQADHQGRAIEPLTRLALGVYDPGTWPDGIRADGKTARQQYQHGRSQAMPQCHQNLLARTLLYVLAGAGMVPI